MVNRSKFLRCALISCPQVVVDSGKQQALWGLEAVWRRRRKMSTWDRGLHKDWKSIEKEWAGREENVGP